MLPWLRDMWSRSARTSKLDVDKVTNAILEKRLDIIIHYIIRTDIFETSPGLRKLLWETFLKPIEELDIGPIYTIEDKILNQLLQDVSRSFVSIDGNQMIHL